MSVQALATTQYFSIRTIPGLWASFARVEPRLAAVSVLLLIALAPTLGAALMDGRTLNGENMWLKPLKFELSLSLFALSLVYFARFLPVALRQSRRYRMFSSAVVAAIVLEMMWILGAAAAGTASHFNTEIPFMTAIYGLMGLLAVLLTSVTTVYAIAIWRDPKSTLPAISRQGLGLGLGLVLPLTLLTAGYMSSQGGHLVEVATNHSGAIPGVGWSATAGDLRVPHFFATHIMHVIAPIALWLGWLRPLMNPLAIQLLTLIYVGGTLAIFWQALGGHPLF